MQLSLSFLWPWKKKKICDFGIHQVIILLVFIGSLLVWFKKKKNIGILYVIISIKKEKEKNIVEYYWDEYFQNVTSSFHINR